MPRPPNPTAGTLPRLRLSRAARKDLREMRRRLLAELGAYASPAERTDLYAALARHADSETDSLRALL